MRVMTHRFADPPVLRRLTAGLLFAAALASLGGAALAEAPLRAPGPEARPAIAARAAASAPASAAAKSARPVLDTRNFTGEIGYAVVDLATGEMLDAHLPDRGFPPASVIKLVTALYGLDTLGPGRRFETRLIASGEIANGVLKGDLCLQGGGDPELDSDDLAELAKQAAALGLTRVEGRFLVDATVLPTLDRIDADQPVYVAYNPSVSGVNLNFNRVLFEWARGAKDLTLQARALGVSPAVNTVSISDAPSVHGVFDYRQTPGMETWMVASSALKREGKRWLPVRRPVAHAADVFRTLAAGAGVTLPPGEAGAAPTGGRVLARVASRPLRDMTRLMLKHSTNLTAEAIGLSASRARGRPVADLAASGREMADWARDYVGAGSGPGSGGGRRRGARARCSRPRRRSGRATPCASPTIRGSRRTRGSPRNSWCGSSAPPTSARERRCATFSSRSI